MKKLSLLLVAAMLLSLCACGHTHHYAEEVTAPTCTEGGYTRYTCACGDTYQGNEVPAGHKEEVVPAVDATCTKDGLTAGKVCSACGEVLVAQEVVVSMGHTYGEWMTVKESTMTETGKKERECTDCGVKESRELPVLDDPNADTYDVIYDLAGGSFAGGYASTAEVGQAFLADFNKYGDGSVVTKENFQSESHPCIKTTLSNKEMLAKWNWLWVYMLEHLKEYNEGKSSEYVSDAYPILERLIKGDTSAVNESANARTTIRSYLHGLLNSMKGCGDINASFSAFSPDFSSVSVQEEFLQHQYNVNATLANGAKLPVPVREGYEFLGWENKYLDIVDKAMCHGTLTALWKEVNPVQKIEITNKVEEIEVQETYQLKWAITPADAGNQRVRFESSDTSIATIDENGRITTYKVGKVTFKIISLSEGGCADTMTVQVVTPEYFDISYETTSYVTIGDEIKLNATYVNRNNEACGVEWKSMDESLATVDENGRVKGLAAGVAKIRASVAGDAEKYQDFVVTILPEDISEGLALVLRAHESNVYTKYRLPVGSGSPNYYSDIFGSISRLLYNKELEIDYTYNKKSNDKYGSDLPGRVMESIEFITVHYTGNYNVGADGNAHGAWFAEPKSENNTSIHYSTGNDGVFKGLDEQYRAAHAGDDGSRNTVSKFSWIDTPVEVLDTDPEFPVVTITEDSTFAINGRDTGVKIPKETKFGRGYVTDSKWLNEMGIGVNVKDGMYQIGTSWWCYTQVGEGRICSNGGNRNSIGIESAVNKGSDLWYTWQITAQLVADIMVRQNLDITKVKGHHFFTAKNCPQPMLEDDLEIWWEFIELVRAEYEKITLCEGYEFEFECDDELVNEHGRVTGQANHSQVVTYKVTIQKDGKTETIELASIIEGSYNK
jgi:hypothetical protein